MVVSTQDTTVMHTVTASTYQLGRAHARDHLGMKTAARKLHYKRKFRNLDISVENRKGSNRYWHDPHTGKKGKTKQAYPYGYIRMTKGMDGDHVDCYVGPNENASHVYIILTNKAPTFESPDEQKCMLGFDSADEAEAVFKAHFDDPRFFRSMTVMPYEAFETRVLNTLHSRNKQLT